MPPALSFPFFYRRAAFAPAVPGWEAVLVVAALLTAAGCANPVPPGGGPRDERPPRIVASQPSAEATNVAGRRVDLSFDEYVDRSSLREALTVTPAPDGRLDFDWSRRSVEITFPTSFRDSTTYLLTIDTAFEDVRGVALEEPIMLAFSTGARIDRGQLSGRVVGNARGEEREGIDVYAYAAADRAGLPDAPLYRTQTGPDGAFQFVYLNEAKRYYVVALRDRNRNYRADPLEAFAVPPRPSLAPRQEAPPGDSARAGAPPSGLGPSPLEAPWVVGTRDRVPPRLTRAQPLSRRRVALRFNEAIQLRSRSPTRFALIDTTTGEAPAIQTVYRAPSQPQRVTLRTAAPLQAGAGYRASLPADSTPAVVDSSGNAPERPAAAAFAAPERTDTLGLRFLGFSRAGPRFPASSGSPTLTLAPGQAPTVRFNQPPGPDSVSAQRFVEARDTVTGDSLPLRLDTDDGTTYRVRFEPTLDSSQVARLRVDGRRLRPPIDTVYTRLARRLPSSTLGAVSGVVRMAGDTSNAPDSAPADSVAAGSVASGSVAADSAAIDSTGSGATPPDSIAAEPVAARPTPPVLVELYPAENASKTPLRTTRADSTGTFVFRNLPEAAYRFRAFLDRDRDGSWDVGEVAPYRPAEPLTWSRRPVEARPRWETAAGDTLRLEDSRPE